MPVVWCRAFRSRGGPNQMIVAHADGSNYLEFLNTNESGGNDVWQHLVDLPLPNCANEHLSIARWDWCDLILFSLHVPEKVESLDALEIS